MSSSGHSKFPLLVHHAPDLNFQSRGQHVTLRLTVIGVMVLLILCYHPPTVPRTRPLFSSISLILADGLRGMSGGDRALEPLVQPDGPSPQKNPG